MPPPKYAAEYSDYFELRALEKQQRQEGQPQKQNFKKDIIKINTF